MSPTPHISEPYNSTEFTIDSTKAFLASQDVFLLCKIILWRFENAKLAHEIRLSISCLIVPFRCSLNPNYWNSSTISINFPLSLKAWCNFLLILFLKITILVFSTLTVRSFSWLYLLLRAKVKRFQIFSKKLMICGSKDRPPKFQPLFQSLWLEKKLPLRSLCCFLLLIKGIFLKKFRNRETCQLSIKIDFVLGTIHWKLWIWKYH